MTIEAFRQNPALTDRMRELMDDPTFALAIETLRRANEPIEPPTTAPEIVSVRMLSQMRGYKAYEERLIEMGLPMPLPVEMEETFEPEN